MNQTPCASLKARPGSGDSAAGRAGVLFWPSGFPGGIQDRSLVQIDHAAKKIENNVTFQEEEVHESREETNI